MNSYHQKWSQPLFIDCGYIYLLRKLKTSQIQQHISKGLQDIRVERDAYKIKRLRNMDIRWWNRVSKEHRESKRSEYYLRQDSVNSNQNIRNFYIKNNVRNLKSECLRMLPFKRQPNYCQIWYSRLVDAEFLTIRRLNPIINRFWP